MYEAELENFLNSSEFFSSGAALIFAGIILAIVSFSIIFSLILYIFKAVALMKISKRLGEKRDWLAWIPFCNDYLLGKISHNIGYGWILAILTFITLSFTNGEKTFQLLPFPILPIASLALFVLTLMSLYKLYKKLSDKAVAMIVFTIFTFGFLAPIFLFAIRNNEIREDKKNEVKATI